MATRFLRRMTWILLMIALVGCAQPPDEQVVELARQHAARQAEQNRQMVELQKDITEGSRRLVEADAQARQELAALQHDLQACQSEIGRQRDELEKERKEIVRQRHRDQVIAAVISTMGLLLSCGLPLLLCIYLLHAVRGGGEADAALAEVLIDELITKRLQLIEHDGRLPPPAEPPLINSEVDEDWEATEDKEPPD